MSDQTKVKRTRTGPTVEIFRTGTFTTGDELELTPGEWNQVGTEGWSEPVAAAEAAPRASSRTVRTRIETNAAPKPVDPDEATAEDDAQ